MHTKLYNFYTDEQHGVLGRFLKGSQEPWSSSIPASESLCNLDNSLSLSCHQRSHEKNEGDDKISSKVLMIFGVKCINL